MFHWFLTSTVFAGAISEATPIATILQNVLNFLLSIIGVLAIIASVVAGLLYLTAAGNPRQLQTAKTAFFYAVIGIVVALGALLLVNQIGDFFAG